jgi:selenocysteine-specific elongation factor
MTKAELATEDEIHETEKSMNRLTPGPVHVVDSLTGFGISQLRETLFDVCRTVVSDRSRTEAPPYLPVDRCFVLKGVGVVVTGTLIRGELRTGQAVSISSQEAEYRIRSLHNHNSVVDKIASGHRVGVHLNGLKLEDARRGDVLVAPAYPCRSRYLNVTLDLLNGAVFRWKPGLRAHFLAGSFETECRLWGLVQSDTGTWAQIHLPEESCFYSGQRFILRSTNPLVTVGGGTIVDIAPDRPRRVTEPEQHRDRYFELSRPGVFDVAALSRKWMSTPQEVATGGIRTASGLVWHSRMDELTAARLQEWIANMKDEPAEWSFPKIATMLKIRPDHVRAYLESFLKEHFSGVLALTSSTLRYDPRRGELSEIERRAAEELLGKVKSAQLQPLRLEEYFAASRVERKVFDKAAARLLKDGRLVRINNEFVVESSAWEELKARVRRGAVESFTASEFGRNVGLSRKYSVPYLECLNRMGLLRRQGDRHVVVR